jgi:hypothetical protein
LAGSVLASTLIALKKWLARRGLITATGNVVAESNLPGFRALGLLA